ALPVLPSPMWRCWQVTGRRLKAAFPQTNPVLPQALLFHPLAVIAYVFPENLRLQALLPGQVQEHRVQLRRRPGRRAGQKAAFLVAGGMVDRRTAGWAFSRQADRAPGQAGTS